MKKKKDSFFLPHVWAFVVLKVKWLQYIPRNIYYKVNRLGWRLVFRLMLSTAGGLEGKLRPLQKYFDFRNWGWNQVMRWMQEHEGWVLSITQPKAEHMKDKWATVAFHNPKYLDVKYETADDGGLIMQSIGLLPLHEHLITNWHLTPEQIEKLKQADPKLISDFLKEFEE